MIYSVLLFVLAAIGLGFLIFIHELGHYLMAKRAGMRVEVFSIGFGKPLYAWDVDGVKWQLGMIPFGGYVRIAGMEKKGSQEPYEIADGYYAKSPLKRILVAIMGPLFNIMFAFIAFALIWLIGGRNISFSEQTKYIGWVAKDSGFYKAEVRAGDELSSINDKPYNNYKDFIYAVMTQKGPIKMDGKIIDYFSNNILPFSYLFDPQKDLSGSGFFTPASFLNFDRAPDFNLPYWSSLSKSGIDKGDRLVCVDGELIFSDKQLIEVLNEAKVLLTIQRDGKTLLCRVPRIKTTDIRFNAQQKGEIDDWQHAAKLLKKVEDLYFIPYNLNTAAVVENEVVYINEVAEPVTYKVDNQRNFFDAPLLEGDKIIAVDGIAINSSSELLSNLQIRKAQVIVKKGANVNITLSSKKADEAFAKGYDMQAIISLMYSIGQTTYPKELKDYKLLPPINLVKVSEIPFSDEMKTKIQEEYAQRRASIEKIENIKERNVLLKELEQSQNTLVLGGVFYDAKVNYNPSPFELLGNSLSLTVKTLASLFSGEISPKHLSGPVAIVSVMKQGIHHGLADALYVLGFISMNLAIFNLLPIPVLDGGHIAFALYEATTKKRLSSKTMEKVIIPFVILLVLLFIYATYNDILKVIKGMF